MQFNENNQDFQQEQTWEGPRQSWMTKLVMKAGLARDEAQANYVLVGIAVVFFVITVVMFMGVGNNTAPSAPASIDDIPPEVLETLPPELIKEIKNAQ